MKCLTKKIIYGCEASGDALSPYLTRLTIFEMSIGALYLHRFHRSDSSEMHDHPWNFWSLILWRGYVEESPSTWCTETQTVPVRVGEVMVSAGEGWSSSGYGAGDSMVVTRRLPVGRKRKRVWPGMLLRRRAGWVHRVELVEGREAWTLVWRGRYVREWGFWTSKGWEKWRIFFAKRGC